jgi:hypothetical protein
VLLIVGFAVSSSYRFRDIGLSGLFCLAPAILIPGTIVSLSNMFQYASLLLGNPWTLVILVPLSCLATCVYLLFFANTGSLASAARSRPWVNRCVVAASVCCFVLGIPYFLLNLSFLFHLPMDVIGPRLWYYMIHFPLPTSLSYAFLATQIAFTLGLFFLMRRFRDA